MNRTPRYTIARVDDDDRGNAVTWEVRRNAQGTADDWDSGQCMGVFDTEAEAETFAHQLRTLTLKACPRCGAGLSNTSYEQYCAYTDCLWNNEENNTAKPTKTYGLIEDEPAGDDDDNDAPGWDEQPITMLALIEAGAVKEHDDVLALMQNVTHGQAHSIAKWLALTTQGPVHLRLMGIGRLEEIRYTLEQVQASIKRA